MGFYTLSHGKFHDRGYSDILYGRNSIDIMERYFPEHSVTTITCNDLVLLPWLCANTLVHHENVEFVTSSEKGSITYEFSKCVT